MHSRIFEHTEKPSEQAVAVLVADPAARRLIEGVTTQLGLVPSILDRRELTAARLSSFEMVVADEPVAREIRRLLKDRRGGGNLIKPALVALTDSAFDPGPQREEEFDALLTLADKPATLSAQFSVTLYSYRAFARRYQSALDELSLNRDIFKSVTSGISVASAQMPDLPLMYVNPAFELMTGYSLEEIQGKNCRFLQGSDRDQPGLTTIREAIAQKRETMAVIKNYRKDGSYFWNELALSPIRNQYGDVTHFVGIQMDVTERVEFEMALRESEKLAAVGRLASAIAHEINNPLEAVMNLVYLSHKTLPTDGSAADADRYLGLADLELRRIKLIAAQSLRFCKQSTGPEAVTCEELLSAIVPIYTPRLANFGIAVERRERSTRHIVCLASEIRQVLTNLISNALDAMRQDGGRLLIRTREATNWKTGEPGVLLTIADTGHGISSKTMANMYKAFYTTKGAAGTGLGLWISSEIVARHHGSLRVRSKAGSGQTGTIFEIFLPLSPENAEAA
jgi:two-component system, sporulation sensor kinase C